MSRQCHEVNISHVGPKNGLLLCNVLLFTHLFTLRVTLLMLYQVNLAMFKAIRRLVNSRLGLIFII